MIRTDTIGTLRNGFVGSPAVESKHNINGPSGATNTVLWGLTTTQSLGSCVMATSIIARARAMHTRCDCGGDHKQLLAALVGNRDACWEWAGATNRDGYGVLTHNGRRWMAHRLAYIAYVGEIPSGLVVDHLCFNRACINPGHLEAVTDRTNILRSNGMAAQNARKTHCKRGHPLPEPNRAGYRRCTACLYLVKPMEVDDPRHGTVNGYHNRKCRCTACKAAWAAYIRQAKARRRAAL